MSAGLALLRMAGIDAFGFAKKSAKTNKVFIVHGHDELLKAQTENLLRRFGLDPIVLHRQVNLGNTIIEKFEANSDVEYAFILLSPDDWTYPDKERTKDDGDRTYERRARPNVIFEWGFSYQNSGEKTFAFSTRALFSLLT